MILPGFQQHEALLFVEFVNQLRGAHCYFADAAHALELLYPEAEQPGANLFPLPGGVDDVPAYPSRGLFVCKIDSAAPHDFPVCKHNVVKLCLLVQVLGERVLLFRREVLGRVDKILYLWPRCLCRVAAIKTR